MSDPIEFCRDIECSGVRSLEILVAINGVVIGK